MNEPNWVFWGGSDSGGWFGFFFTFFDPRQVFSLMKVSLKKKKKEKGKSTLEMLRKLSIVKVKTLIKGQQWFL